MWPFNRGDDSDCSGGHVYANEPNRSHTYRIDYKQPFRDDNGEPYYIVDVLQEVEYRCQCEGCYSTKTEWKVIFHRTVSNADEPSPEELLVEATENRMD